MLSNTDDASETGSVRRSSRTNVARAGAAREAPHRPGTKGNGSKEKRSKVDPTPTTPARRALAARAAGPEAGPTTAQLMAAEESRRLAVESESQMAELLSQEADRADELEVKVARSDKSAARWERKYSALKEGVDTLVDTVKQERDTSLQEQTVLKALIEENATLKRELKAVKEDAELHLLNLRESVRLQHELSAALEADHADRARTATARDCGAPSGADEDECEDEDEHDDGEYEDAADNDGDDSDGSAEQIRDELLAFAAGRSSSAEST